MSGDNTGLQGVGLNVGWEIDVWGRVRYGRAAADAHQKVDAGQTQREASKEQTAAHAQPTTLTSLPGT